MNAETGLKVRADFWWGGSSGNNNDWGLVGAKDALGGNNSTRLLMVHMYNQKPYIGYGLGSRGNPSNVMTNFVRGARCEIVSDFSDASALQVYQNGDMTLTSSDQEIYAAHGNVNLGIPLYAFAYNNGGTAMGKCSAGLYGLRILKKNGSGGFDIVRNYLPCKKNGRAALYDTVNGTISFSDTETDFVAGPELPAPCEFVEWVESDAKNTDSAGKPIVQYIDTRVIGKSGIRSEVDVMLLNDYTGDHGILACRKDSGQTRFYLAYYYQSVFRYAYMTLPPREDLKNWVSSTTVKGRYFIKSDLSLTNQSVKVNGKELHSDTIAHSNVYFNTGTPLALFGMREGNGIKVRTLMRLYSCKIWDGDELMRDYLPCVASDGRAGLYDTVSRRVFMPGSSQFDLEDGVGPCTNSLVTVDGTLPDKKISYIESDGTNDYFDVGVMAKDGVEMEAVMEWLTVPDDDAFVGARSDTPAIQRFFPYHYWNGYHRIGYLTNIYVVGAAAAANQKYKLLTRLDDGSQTASISTFANGAWGVPTSVSRASSGPVDTGLSLYLFACNYKGMADYFGHARVYKLKFREKQQDGSYVLTRDFVPCMKDGKAMLYDNVSGAYFRNRGRYLAIGGGHERDWGPFGTRIIIR